MSRIINCPGHTREVFDIEKFPLIVRWAKKIILAEEADAMVACGHSGLLLAGTLQYLTKIPVFAVRKAGEETIANHGMMVSGIATDGPAKRWVWVDDFLSCGRTFRASRDFAKGAGLIAGKHPIAVVSYGKYRDQEFVAVTESDAWYPSSAAKPRDGESIYKHYGFRKP